MAEPEEHKRQIQRNPSSKRLREKRDMNETCLKRKGMERQTVHNLSEFPSKVKKK